MCIPPAGEAPAPHFALLREIARRNGLAGLSMGMSGDYEIALGFDASLVRVGTAIFGARAAAAAAAGDVNHTGGRYRPNTACHAPPTAPRATAPSARPARANAENRRPRRPRPMWCG